jgi:CspA family cold shock protein
VSEAAVISSPDHPSANGPVIRAFTYEEIPMATGVVRFFNAAKGFGLITPDLGGPALFAAQAAIRTPGVKNLKATQRVEFEVEQRPEGPAAANIRTLA